MEALSRTVDNGRGYARTKTTSTTIGSGSPRTRRPEACGWLKDKFGLSWQIVPTAMDRMLGDKDPERVARVTQALLPMKKLDIATLEKAYRGK